MPQFPARLGLHRDNLLRRHANLLTLILEQLGLMNPPRSVLVGPEVVALLLVNYFGERLICWLFNISPPCASALNRLVTFFLLEPSAITTLPGTVAEYSMGLRARTLKRSYKCICRKLVSACITSS